MAKKSVFFEVARVGQSPQVSFVFIHFFILLLLPLCFAFPHRHWNSPSKNSWFVSLSVITEARDGKGLLGHPVSLAVADTRTGQQREEEGFQVSSGRFSHNYWHVRSKAQQYLCFLLSTEGPGPCNSNIILRRKPWVWILNLWYAKETKCW